jgi:SAM-dependent methyltransferase
VEAAPPLADTGLSATDHLLIDELLALEGSMDRNYQWAYEVIAPFLGGSLLEVGSGVGVISKFLIQRAGPVVLSDHHPAYLRYLRSRFGDCPNVTYQLLDLNDPVYDVGARAIDTVVCLNVLEHLADDQRALRGFAQLLPPGGRVVLQVPNYPALFGSLDAAYGHFRRYTRQMVTAAVTASGFRLVRLRNFNPLAIPGWIVSAKLLRARRLNVHSARLFNAIVPIARRLDFLSRFAGLALIAIAERTRDQ